MDQKRFPSVAAAAGCADLVSPSPQLASRGPFARQVFPARDWPAWRSPIPDPARVMRRRAPALLLLALGLAGADGAVLERHQLPDPRRRRVARLPRRVDYRDPRRAPAVSDVHHDPHGGLSDRKTTLDGRMPPCSSSTSAGGRRPLGAAKQAGARTNLCLVSSFSSCDALIAIVA